MDQTIQTDHNMLHHEYQASSICYQYQRCQYREKKVYRVCVDFIEVPIFFYRAHQHSFVHSFQIQTGTPYGNIGPVAFIPTDFSYIKLG